MGGSPIAMLPWRSCAYGCTRTVLHITQIAKLPTTSSMHTCRNCCESTKKYMHRLAIASGGLQVDFGGKNRRRPTTTTTSSVAPMCVLFPFFPPLLTLSPRELQSASLTEGKFRGFMASFAEPKALSSFLQSVARDKQKKQTKSI